MTKILLVEDDKSLREIYNVRLGAEGYDIVSAGDGEEALALAIKERPDLIVSDVMMPKISGFDMLDILRSTTETKNVKVIMMTALSNEEQRRRGLALGADRYLVKSQVGIEDVVRTVHEVLEDDSSAATGPAPLVSSEDTDDDIYDISAPEQTESTSATMTPPRPSTTSSITLPARPNPSAAPQSSQPRIITQPTPAPITPPVSPPATTATPTPVTAPVPVSSASSTMSIASATTAPQPSTLPQPVAPFSTPRPGSSGHIIQPLEHDNSKDIVDITARMSQELAGTQTIDAIPAPQPVSVSTPTPQPAPITPPVSPSTTTTASPTPEAIPTAFTAPTAPDTPPIDLSTVTNRPGSDSLKQEPTLPSAIAANAPQPITSPASTPQPQPLTSLAPQAQKSPIPQQQTSAPTTPSPSYTAQSAPITPQPATPAQGGSTEQPATNQTTPPLAATPPLPASSTPPTPTPTPTPATTSSNTSRSGLEFEETARADTPASQTML